MEAVSDIVLISYYDWRHLYCLWEDTQEITKTIVPSFPKDAEKRAKWLKEFGLPENQLKSRSGVCSRHFRDGDPRNGPEMTVGKRFASPMKKDVPRSKRAKVRQLNKEYQETLRSSSSRSVTPNPPSSSARTPSMALGSSMTGTTPSPTPPPPLTAQVGEQLEVDYSVHELPTSSLVTNTQPTEPQLSNADQSIINRALLARIEFLESENDRLKKELSESHTVSFSIEQIRDDDKLVSFYTGFRTYSVFLAFFNFLGPAVDKLTYWGRKPSQRHHHRATKVSPVNQLLMTLMRLRLNLKVLDLSVRFGVSRTAVSRYVTTWICFLYQHLKEIDWMPSVEQVSGTLPPAFQEHYPTTYAIIDGSEIFMGTPTDLQMQSSTRSSYKHHNTAKFLIACTPNGSICFISPLYVGSISDVEITKASGFLTHLEDKPGISIMADRGFTIKDMLKEIGIELNIPPFMEGRQQLPREEVEKGRRIVSVRIHVERAIGRIKSFLILKETLPITLARLSNQIVFVCAYLSNFKPVLVPSSTTTFTDTDEDVDKYFEDLSDTSAR